jgi:hypothetical protein
MFECVLSSSVSGIATSCRDFARRVLDQIAPAFFLRHLAQTCRAMSAVGVDCLLQRLLSY